MVADGAHRGGGFSETGLWDPAWELQELALVSFRAGSRVPAVAPNGLEGRLGQGAGRREGCATSA